MNAERLQPWQVRISAANLLGYVFEAFDLTVYSLFVGVIAKYFGLPLWYSFLILTLTYVMRAVGGLFFGAIADRLGRRTTLITTVLGYSVCTLLTGLAWGVWPLVVFRSITGMFIGGEYVSYAYTMEGVPSKSRGLFSGFFQIAYSLGYFFAAFGFGVVSKYVGGEGWRYVFIIGIVPAVIALWVRLGVEESHIWEGARDRGRVPYAPVKEIFKGAYLPTTLQCLIFLIGLHWAFASLQHTYPTYLRFLKESSGDITTLTMMVSLGGMVGAVLFGTLSQRLGRKSMLLASCAGALICAPLYVPFWMSGRPGYLYLAVFAFIQNVFQTGTYAILPAWLSERFPTAVRATGSAGVYNLAQAVGGWADLFLARAAGTASGPWATAMVVFGAAGLGLCIVVASFARETVRVDLETVGPEGSFNLPAGATGA